MLTHISVRGAREHNLKNINVDMPHDKLLEIMAYLARVNPPLPKTEMFDTGFIIKMMRQRTV